MFFIYANLTLAGVLLITGILTLKMVSYANQMVMVLPSHPIMLVRSPLPMGTQQSQYGWQHDEDHGQLGA